MVLEDVANKILEEQPTTDGEGGAPFKRAPRGRRKGSKVADGQVIKPPREPYVKTDAGVAMSGALGALLWDFGAPFMRCKPLSDEQKHHLGEALDPVLYKYLPILGNFAEEAALVMCLLALYQTNRIKDEEPKVET